MFAIAHVRCGSEMAEVADRGMFAKKNTFTDFIAVAEHLIREKWTSKDRLAIEGGSAGGLLVGAVVNMRPDLFAAAIARVPFVDVINTMLDSTLPLTVGEFEEWGDPRDREQYEYMKSYSPYDNIAARAYPAMLVKTSFNDSQVMYWEPAKYVARLREMRPTQSARLQGQHGGGHGGSSAATQAEEEAFDYAFCCPARGREVLSSRVSAFVPCYDPPNRRQSRVDEVQSLRERALAALSPSSRRRIPVAAGAAARRPRSRSRITGDRGGTGMPFVLRRGELHRLCREVPAALVDYSPPAVSIRLSPVDLGAGGPPRGEATARRNSF